MARFRRRPREIEATQFTGDLHPHVGKNFSGFYTTGKQGVVNVNVGDWIIEEMDGSGHYPCSPAIFEITYEAIPDAD